MTISSDYCRRNDFYLTINLHATPPQSYLPANMALNQPIISSALIVISSALIYINVTLIALSSDFLRSNGNKLGIWYTNKRKVK